MNADHKPIRVLFVCLGNICRSPAGESVLRKLVDDAGRADDFEIDSAGVIDYHVGEPTDRRMATTLRTRGYLADGRARQIRATDLDHFDLIVAMDEDIHESVSELDPSGRNHGKIREMVDFFKRHHLSRVPDPYHGGQEGFDHVVELMEDGCAEILRSYPKAGG